MVPEKYPGVNSSSVNFRPELNLATYLNDFNYYLRINVQFLPLFSHLNMGLEISAAPPIRSLNSSAGGRNSNGARSWPESNLLAGGLRLSAWQKGLSGVPVVICGEPTKTPEDSEKQKFLGFLCHRFGDD